jgi:hypothetical protein
VTRIRILNINHWIFALIAEQVIEHRVIRFVIDNLSSIVAVGPQGVARAIKNEQKDSQN